MPTGTGKNTMTKLAEKFEEAQVKFTLNDGSVVGLKKKVKVTGLVTWVSETLPAIRKQWPDKHPYVCKITVTQLDKA